MRSVVFGTPTTAGMPYEIIGCGGNAETWGYRQPGTGQLAQVCCFTTGKG
jgi:hypothetical protein